MIPDLLGDDLEMEQALQEARLEFHSDIPSESVRQFVYACEISEIPSNGKRGKVIVCDYDEIALFCLGGAVHAISNLCPHQLAPVLAEGHVDLENSSVTCPMHGWAYDITTGKAIGGSGCVQRYEAKVDGSEVWVEEPKERMVVSSEDDIASG